MAQVQDRPRFRLPRATSTHAEGTGHSPRIDTARHTTLRVALGRSFWEQTASSRSLVLLHTSQIEDCCVGLLLFLGTLVMRGCFSSKAIAASISCWARGLPESSATPDPLPLLRAESTAVAGPLVCLSNSLRLLNSSRMMSSSVSVSNVHRSM